MYMSVNKANIGSFDTLRPRQNGRRFEDDTFKCIFLNENVIISIKISLKFDCKGPMNNISSLVQIMALRRPGDKPLSEPMMASSLTHIGVTRPQWVNSLPPVLQQAIICTNADLQLKGNFYENTNFGISSLFMYYKQDHHSFTVIIY